MRNVALFNWIKISTFIITKTCLPFTLLPLPLCLPVFGPSSLHPFSADACTRTPLHPIIFPRHTCLRYNKPVARVFFSLSFSFSKCRVAWIDFSSRNFEAKKLNLQVFLENRISNFLPSLSRNRDSGGILILLYRWVIDVATKTKCKRGKWCNIFV